ncbi:hypothetical protein SCG7086_AA_00070 [Chlamydiales bacterium SCGC AG-110-P3]|nr:hypothetical protein SCG7086_AA_00070 [Chlamydiales bacterium SCGC AG-110-P3]
MSNITKLKDSLQSFRSNAAGIDIGCHSHFVAVPSATCEQSVREFSSFTDDLYKIAEWLQECGITTVAMESTSVYWIPLYEILEEKNFEVFLVNSQHVKNAPGRKTDVQDAQWLQQLHTYGLLQNSFRPKDVFLELRAFCRQRTMLIEEAASFVMRMQKALTQMNIQLNNVIRDVTGLTGMNILRDIVKGERNPKVLASHRHFRCKNSEEVIARSLQGNFRKEHVFALKQAIEMHDFYNQKIKECEMEIEKRVRSIESSVIKLDPARQAIELGECSDELSSHYCKTKVGKKLKKHEFSFDVETSLKKITGCELTAIPGLGESAALTIISETGVDMRHWKNSKHFASWLGLCPKNKISGGRVLNSRTRPGARRVAWILRMCATCLHHSKTALGAHLRRLKSRLGAPKAITAIAHKLAKMLYNMLKYGTKYVEEGQEQYEKRYQERRLNNLLKQARQLGLELSPTR